MDSLSSARTADSSTAPVSPRATAQSESSAGDRTLFVLPGWFRRWLPGLAGAVFAAFFLLHFVMVWRCAVNIASDDEWSVFRDPKAISLRWILTQHNEHRIVTTKLLIWILYQLNGWNHRSNIIFNFVVYGVIVVWLIWSARRLAPRIPLWAILGFTVFLLSPILWMNHLIGLQVCFHFWLLSFLVSTYFLFGSIQSWQRLSIGVGASLISLYSLGSGLASVPIVLLSFCLFKIIRARAAGSGPDRAPEIRQLILVAGGIGIAMGLFFIGYSGVAKHPRLALPFELRFWRQLLNLVSFGFGVDLVSTRFGAICLLIVVAPIVWQVWQQRGKLSASQWTVYVTVIAILGTLASVASARAPFGVDWSKTSRYAEIGMPLIILSVLSWSWVLERKRLLEISALAGLWFFCLVAFSDNWRFNIYRQVAANKKLGALCVQAYYEKGSGGLCPNLWPTSLAAPLDRAKQMNVSFYRELTARTAFDRQQANNSAPPGGPEYSGRLDQVSCQRIAGWATSRPRPQTWLTVEIYDGQRLIGSVPADVFRPDVYQAGAGALLSGFDFPIPAVVRDGRPHSITVRIAGTSQQLSGSTGPITCSSAE